MRLAPHTINLYGDFIDLIPYQSTNYLIIIVVTFNLLLILYFYSTDKARSSYNNFL